MKVRIYIIGLFFASCNFVGGSGKIKGYQYEVSQQVLKDAVADVLISHPYIRVDTSLNNESYMYITVLRFRVDSNQYEYDVSYTLGDTANEAELAIVHAWENNSGGAEGRNSFKGKEELRARLIHVFDSVVANKIDSFLGMAHDDEFN